MSWLDHVRWNANGLVAAIAQDATTHKVLTLAWMNREALSRTDRKEIVRHFVKARMHDFVVHAEHEDIVEELFHQPL